MVATFCFRSCSLAVYSSPAKLRFEDEIESEVKKLQAEVEEDRAIGVATWSDVFSIDNNMRKRLTLGYLFQGFQQLCGINAIMFYAPDILVYLIDVSSCLSRHRTVGASRSRFGGFFWDLQTLSNMLRNTFGRHIPRPSPGDKHINR
jgi:hypothetical protein